MFQRFVLFMGLSLALSVSAQDAISKPDSLPRSEMPAVQGAEVKERPAPLIAESKPDTSVELENLVVTAKSAQKKEGGAKRGYRVDTAALGALGKMNLQDMPYSVSVTSSDFIDNIQAGTTTDALKYNPTVNPEMGSNRSGDYLAIRGFINSENHAIDGVRTGFGFSGILEDKERIEVLNGASSFLYGMASPAGMVNFVLKRPTAEPMLEIKLGDYGGEQAFAHVDAGGPLGPGNRFGYRLNLLAVSNGSTGIAGESNQRFLESGAFDWHITPRTVLFLDGSGYQRKLEHMQAFFLLGSATQVPDAPDASKNYAPSYAGSENVNATVGIKVSSQINKLLSIRSAFRYSLVESDGFRSMRNKWTDNAGDYNQQMMFYNGAQRTTTAQGNFFLDLSFKTGFITQDVSLGSIVDHFEFSSTLPGTHKVLFPATTVFNMDNPGNNPDPNSPYVKDGTFHMSQNATRQYFLAADRISFENQWTIMGGITYAGINDKNYDEAAPYQSLSTYDKGQVSPSVALTFKPHSAVSLYASYNEALEEGPVAPDGAENANEKLDPYMSHQAELGAKTFLGKFSLNAALFRLDKANDYLDAATNVFSEDGREVHMGGELSFSGKITNDITLIGGLSELAAKMEKTDDETIKDKSPQAVPQVIGRLYAEYAIPPVAGLVVAGGVSYTGKEWVNNINTISIPSVITGDVGVRYGRVIWKKDLALRLNVSNVSGANYWTTKGGGMLYLGSPRTFSFSAAIGF